MCGFEVGKLPGLLKPCLCPASRLQPELSRLVGEARGSLGEILWRLEGGRNQPDRTTQYAASARALSPLLSRQGEGLLFSHFLSKLRMTVGV